MKFALLALAIFLFVKNAYGQKCRRKLAMDRQRNRQKF